MTTKQVNKPNPNIQKTSFMYASTSFQEKLAQLLHESFPESKEIPADEMRRILQTVLAKASGYGLNTEADQASYVITSYVLGQDFDVEVPEAAQVLRSSEYTSQQKAAILEDFVQQATQALEHDETLAQQVGDRQAADRKSTAPDKESSVSDYLSMESESAPYRQLADWAFERLTHGDAASVIAHFSPHFIEYLGLPKVESVFQEQMLPFFAASTGLEKSTTITRTHDNFGSSGFAFYMSLTESKSTKPFVIYIVKENDRLVVANVILNKTYQDLH